MSSSICVITLQKKFGVIFYYNEAISQPEDILIEISCSTEFFLQ